MNALTLSATFGILVLVFQDGRFEGAARLPRPGRAAADAAGARVRDRVRARDRLRRLPADADQGGVGRGLPNREAVAVGLERTGRIVTAAALLFCIAVGAFATSKVILVKEVGIGIALAVAIDATIVRALLVPSLMAILGRWNWWPARRRPPPIRRPEPPRRPARTSGAGRRGRARWSSASARRRRCVAGVRAGGCGRFRGSRRCVRRSSCRRTPARRGCTRRRRLLPVREGGGAAAAEAEEGEFGGPVEPAGLVVGVGADRGDADHRVRLREGRGGLEVAAVDVECGDGVVRHEVVRERERQSELPGEPRR